MSNLCIYHSSDLDGHCSGAIVYRHFEYECLLTGMDYQDDFPWHMIDEETILIMVDFSRPREEMLKILSIVKEFHWIDHHKTSLEEMEGVKIDGLREVGQAGCELTWKYFHDNKPVPAAVRLLGRYDVWDLDYSTMVLPFQYGMRLNRSTLPFMAFWDDLLEMEDSKWIEISKNGLIALEFEKIQNEKFMRTCAFEAEIDGLRCICANVPMSNSQRFDSVWDPSKYDAVVPFYRTRSGLWKVSMFSDKPGVDVSIPCKKRGGGGHKGAAGFHTDTISELFGGQS
jgi:oligoribonuclease NrnB/cAMP/cGMP phosphodiesterase (DHH superfamily)